MATLERLNIRRILVPTDLRDDANLGLAHGIKLALATGATLRVLHVHDDVNAPVKWSKLPTVRRLLEAWGVLPVGATLDDYKQLGLKVELGAATSNDTVNGVMDVFEREHVDFAILPTSAKTGVERLFHPSVAEGIARRTGVMSLFLPSGAGGLVDLKTGRVGLKRFLLPVSETDEPELALAAAARFAVWLGVDNAEFVLLHVGTRDSMPDVRPGNGAGWVWKSELRTGPVIPAIIASAQEHKSDLIVMTTQGHNSVGDTLIGTHAEKVVRSHTAPVLVVPQG